MKQRQTDAQSEALRVYQKYWESYVGGDLDAFSATLDEKFEMIGTTEGEVCHSKADGIAFYKAQMAEVVGKVEMRNSQITVGWLDPLVLINETCDIYVKTDQGWNFYSKLRLSTLLKETNEGWKVVQQHGSLPDMRVEDGQTIAIEKISKENLELRDAIKRRTIELEQKNRELEVEAALERVRARTMAMQKSEELGEVATVLFSELNSLVDDLWTCGFVFCAENRQEDEWWLSLSNGLIQPFFLPNVGDFTHETLYQGWERGEAYRTVTLENAMLREHYDWLMNIPIARQIFDEMEGSGIPRPNWQRLHAAYFKTGYLVVITEIPCHEEEIFKRFAQVFDLTYTRFLDLQKAEAQAREAQIETAMERIRARAMAMHSSSELLEVAQVLREQMGWLHQPDLETSAVLIYHDDQNSWDSWYAFRPTQDLNGAIRNGIATFNKDDCGFTREITRRFQLPEKDYTLALSGAEREEWIEVLMKAAPEIAENALANETVNFDTTYFHFSDFSGGSLLTVTYHSPSEEIKSLQGRAASVFDLAYRRFLDLQKAEAQARESQVQLALERVRARTMAMQKSSELPEAANLLFQQIQSLGMPAWSAGYCTWDDDEKSSVTLWMSSEGVLQPPFTAPTTEDELFIEMRKGQEDGKAFHVVEMGGDKLVRHYQYMRTLPVVGEILDSIIEAGHPLPTFQIMHQAYFSKGFLLFITYEPVPESHEIFKRFAKVFDQTYTRFLDLQKAEAQAREAEIQLALERVRARTMAMQSSEEMAEVSYLLNKQVVDLGIPTRGCAFNIYNENDSTEWFSNLEGTFPAYKTPREYIFQTYYEAGQRGETLLIDEFGGDRIKELYQYFASRNNSGNEAIDNHLAKVPEYQINHLAYFKYGYLLFITLVPAPEAYDIFKRFAKEFEQTYTRFLDLQKAEAQAREAQIEAALERVRATSLAMHHSAELSRVVTSLLSQLVELRLSFNAALIWTFDREKNDIQIWIATPVLPDPVLVQLPYDEEFKENQIIKQIWHSVDQGIDTINQVFTGQIKNHYYDYAIKYNDEKVVPHHLRELIYELDWTVSYAAEKNSLVGLDSWSGQFLSIDDFQILKRFAKVFEQAYTRFLDLQKAEAQTRESQIQLALERVRARSMAMYHSDEITEVVKLLYKEFDSLNLSNESTDIEIGLIDEETGMAKVWAHLYLSDGSISTFNFPFTHFVETNNEFGIWQSTPKEKRLELFITTEYTGKNWNRFKNLAREIPELKEMFAPMFTPNIKKWVSHNAYFSHGLLTLQGTEHYSKETQEIQKRFAKVFEQTYTRFLDLQKAEEQARESQIQLSLERIRAKAMAMQRTDELSGFLTVLFEQFNVLNLNPVFCHLSFFDIENNRFTYRMTGRNGAAVIATQEIDFEATPLWKQNFEDWKSGHPYQVGGLYIPKERIPEMVDIFKDILEKLPEDERPLIEDFPNGQYVVDGYCRFGYLGYSAGRPPSDDEKEITRRIANEFGNVYQRFLDLEKAEAQAREAQIQLSLERIRAKAMSMQHSDELGDFLSVVFEQFNVLNLNPVFCQLSLIDLETNRSTFRMTGKNGSTLIATQAIDLDASPAWNQKIEDYKAGQPIEVDVLYYPYELLPEIAALFQEIVDKLPEEVRPQMEDFPNGHYVVDGYCKYGYLGYSASRPPTEEEKEITRRIANEFGNVYQRFLDLQKAEAQAREAQIQLSLERIRAKAMAMQHSDELSDFLTVVFEQFEVLNLSPVSCQLSFFDIENNRSTFRMTSKNGAALIATQEVDLDASPIWEKKVMDWKTGHPNDVDVLYIPFENLPEIAEIFKEIRSKLPNDELPQIADFPNGQYVVEGYCKYGYLGYIASRPPSDEEKEITRRIANEFGNVYQRFLDLQKAEAQAREAQIEAALERIRAKGMAMHHSGELKDVLTVLFNQFDILGIKPVQAQLSLFDLENNRFTFRSTGKRGRGNMGEQVIDMNAMDTWKETIDSWKASKPKSINSVYFPKETLPQVWELFDELRKQLPEEDLITLEAYPDGAYVTEGNFNYGYIGFSHNRKATAEEEEIVIRFATEFGRLYQRFLDLQKAEAQAREAQIEAALEKVRSTSLAMHKAEELENVVAVVFQKLKELGLTFDVAGIQLYSEGSMDIIQWVAAPDLLSAPRLVHLPYVEKDLKESEIIKDYWAAKEKGKSFCNRNYSFDEKNKFFRYAGRHNDLTAMPEEVRDFQLMAPAYTQTLIAEKRSALWVDSYSGQTIPNEGFNILTRFARVFEQAYIRFLDLQKAEAQAREAQIEAALERVRSRSMGMQRGADLKGVVKELYDQLRLLGFQSGVASIIIMDADTGDLDWWMEGFEDGYDLPEKYHVPYFDHKGHRQQIEQWKNGSNYAIVEISGIEKKDYDAYYFSQTDFAKAPETSKSLMMSLEAVSFSMAYMKYGSLSWSPSKLDENQAVVLQRMAKVFEQTYTRFLDLQKAEAQAREAQIEAALEKIRSRSLRMHHSNELREVISIFFEKLIELEVLLGTVAIQLFDQEGMPSIFWVGNAIQDPQNVHLPYDATIKSEDNYLGDGWKAMSEQNEIINKVYSKAQKDRFFEHLFDHNNLTQIPENAREVLKNMESHVICLFPSKNSGLFVDSWDGRLYPADDLHILRRAGKVFEQAYIRFLDLQKAEAQAREAQIEAGLERVRSKTMAMHNSKDVGESVATLFDELTALGVLSSYDRCGIGIMQPHEMMEVWTAEKSTGKTELTIGYLDMRPHALLRNVYQSWLDRKETFHYTLEGEDKQLYAEAIVNQSKYKIRRDYFSSLEKIEHTDFFFEEGCLYVFSVEVISSESAAVFSRFVKVFGQTYRRYLDLQKAEKQAREAQIEAALEKVRSRTMAMQSSEELADAAYVLFEQLKSLGVTHERINIGIVNEDKKTIDFWITEQGGDRLNTKFSGRISEPTTLSKAYAAWKNGEKSMMVDLQGEELKSWLSYLNDEIKIPFNKAFLHDRRVQTAGFFSKGMLILTSPEPLQQEALYLLEKFAGVFDLTYTRFSDLKLAEAQALQAEKDLIEIKIARQKAEDALAELKATQAQLIQQEKLASLGQLTAGIAHEIKNPLNFVNNFSEVSIEMIGEVIDSRLKTQETRPKTEADEIEDEILEDIKANLEKIHEHGSRANGIVTSMLQHSRGGSGKKEPTDLNALIKEYVNLSFHGMRAGKNPIDVEIELNLDDAVNEVSLVKEDFTRVIINLCNNAFDAMRGKTQEGIVAYRPKLTVCTKSEKDQIAISVEDNGPGIPDEIKDKVLQPFFTTKKGTEGTGLGLSITHDIVKAHGGELSINTEKGEWTRFSIHLQF